MVESASPQLLFVMQSNLVLHANFVSNPFLVVQGIYAGLLHDPAGVRFDSSGYVSATLNPIGSFSARALLGGRGYSLSGKFSPAGFFSNSIPRRGMTSLSVQLQVDFGGGDRMSGIVSDGAFASQISAHRATFSATTNPPPQSGKRFTLVIPPTEDSPLLPGGNGYGSLTVDRAGHIRFAGTLGDGTHVSEATFLSRTGRWPFFTLVYGGRGSILGELAFANQPESDVSGALSWFRPAVPNSRVYPAGFALTNGLVAVGAEYSFTRGRALLTLTNSGEVLLEGGGLLQTVTNGFALDPNNRVTGTNRLRVGFNVGNGFFSGQVINPGTGRAVPIAGALLLKQNAGFGQFQGTNRSGSVYLGPSLAVPVVPPPPMADFTASPVSGAAPLTVAFSNRSRNATTYLWDFGDGNGSGLEQPTYTYFQAGAYSVSLSAISLGGTNFLRRANYIAVTNPPTSGTNLPSRILDLTEWKLTLPVDTARAGSPDEIFQPELAQFSDPNFFYADVAGDGVVFTAPCGGATTSGSSYPRSELREMTSDGTVNAGWSTTSGTHTMEINEAITHLPVAKPQIVAGQIHGPTDDVTVFRLEGTKLFVDENGNAGPVLNSDYHLGDVFTVKFVAHNGGVDSYYNGQYVYTYAVSQSGCYFKAGCYTQSNTSTGDAPTAYGQVIVYRLNVTHQ